jgi:hypothetical protein
MIRTDGFYVADLGGGFQHVVRFYNDNVIVGHRTPGGNPNDFARLLVPGTPLPTGTYSYEPDERRLQYVLNDLLPGYYSDFIGFLLDDDIRFAGVKKDNMPPDTTELTYVFVPFAAAPVGDVLNADVIG